ncbi:MAG: pentapeptide repeat-containing protein [Opitutaceae bacterium]|nr:pentapeptide repeat-containing protein [Opitutaceae bacterium]
MRFCSARFRRTRSRHTHFRRVRFCRTHFRRVRFCRTRFCRARFRRARFRRACFIVHAQQIARRIAQLLRPDVEREPVCEGGVVLRAGGDFGEERGAVFLCAQFARSQHFLDYFRMLAEQVARVGAAVEEQRQRAQELRIRRACVQKLIARAVARGEAREAAERERRTRQRGHERVEIFGEVTEMRHLLARDEVRGVAANEDAQGIGKTGWAGRNLRLRRSVQRFKFKRPGRRFRPAP